MKKVTSQSGLTLVELMVALTLFTFAVLAAVSSLYAANSASRKVGSIRATLDSVNFAMESMSRTIRTSTNIICDGVNAPSGATHNCPFPLGTPASRISMNSTLGVPAVVEYRLNGVSGQIEKRVDEGGGFGAWIAITSSEVTVQSLSFYVQGADTTDTTQPSVIIVMKGIARVPGEETIPFSLHTLVSQRAVE